MRHQMHDSDEGEWGPGQKGFERLDLEPGTTGEAGWVGEVARREEWPGARDGPANGVGRRADGPARGMARRAWWRAGPASPASVEGRPGRAGPARGHGGTRPREPASRVEPASVVEGRFRGAMCP